MFDWLLSLYNLVADKCESCGSDLFIWDDRKSFCQNPECKLKGINQ